MQVPQLSKQKVPEMKRPVLTVAATTLFTCAAFPAFALQIFVSNEKDNTVTVIDGKTLEAGFACTPIRSSSAARSKSAPPVTCSRTRRPTKC